ncbi:MAG: hypothetical protein U0X39_05790 [Bacteroidales bacterium]
MDLDYIRFTKKSPADQIINCGKSKTLLDFWQWAYSDLVGNTERGILAEYLVALACNIEESERISWDSFDLLVDDKIKVEVKSSSYLQSWRQKNYSRPIFGIARTKAWDPVSGIFESQSKRQADLYVFALLSHQDKPTLNPVDTNQWEFYVLSTRIINSFMGDKKSISLDKIKELGAAKCDFKNLHFNIQVTYGNLASKL